MRVGRALEKLRRTLQRRGIVSTAGALAAVLGTQAAAAVPAGLAGAVATNALSAAAVAGGGALTLYLMTITKTHLAAALAVVAAGAVLIGVNQQQEIDNLRRELGSRSTAGDREAHELQVKLAASATAVASLRAQVQTLKGGSAPGARWGAAGAGPDTFKVVHLKDILRDHPEYAELEDKESRHLAVLRYAKGIAALNLPADQATKLKQLLVEKDISENDARRAADRAGVSPEERNKAMDAAGKELNQSIVALIGTEGNDTLQALKEDGNPETSRNLTADMLDAGIPPSDDQATALAQMLYDAGQPSKTPAASDPGYHKVDPSTWLSPLDQQFLTQAATVLTPAQVEILKAFRSDENHRQAIIREYLHDGAGMITY
jgi:NACalpha-BTF3-like transcription factor